MANLEADQKKILKEALLSVSSSWIVCGIRRETEIDYSCLDGIPGLLDWESHGQVSKLMRDGKIPFSETCLVPGDPQKKRPSYLLFPLSQGSNVLLEKIRHLQIREFCLAESTFPHDFLAKLKQNLKKEGIQFISLEPKTE